MRRENFEHRFDLSRNNDAILEAYGQRIQEAEQGFVDAFGLDEIMDDKRHVAKLKHDFHVALDNLGESERRAVLERQKISEVLEVIIVKHGEESNWFGDSAYLSRTSEYDDIHNGVDAVVEFNLGEGESEKLALAIDASTNADTTTISRKMNRCYDRVSGKTEEPQKVKYFTSRVSDYQGRLPLVVPVVVGLESKNLSTLIEQCGDLINIQKHQDNSDMQKKRKKELQSQLENSPAKIIFLNEILTQLQSYTEVLNRVGDKNNYVPSIKKLTGIISAVLRRARMTTDNKMEMDEVYNRIGAIAGDMTETYTLEKHKIEPPVKSSLLHEPPTVPSDNSAPRPPRRRIVMMKPPTLH